MANFTFFMAHLAAPPRAGDRGGSAQDRGQHAVQLGGAAVLGLPPLGRRHLRVDVGGRHPGRLAFAPFSDFLVHDMGTLGDGIGNTGDTVAVTRRMRTAPLWGLRSRNLLLHDGRTSDRGAAIAAHNGGATARARRPRRRTTR